MFIISAIFLITPFIHVFTSEQVNPEYYKAKDDLKDGVITEAEYEIKRQKYTVFGFNSPSSFWYAIGQPLFAFFVSVVLIFSSNLISIKEYRRIFKNIGYCSLFIASFFLVWVFWYRNDFPKFYYYLSISGISLFILLTVRTVFYIQNIYLKRKEEKQKEIESFIVQSKSLIEGLNI